MTSTSRAVYGLLATLVLAAVTSPAMVHCQPTGDSAGTESSTTFARSTRSQDQDAMGTGYSYDTRYGVPPVSYVHYTTHHTEHDDGGGHPMVAADPYAHPHPQYQQMRYLPQYHRQEPMTMPMSGYPGRAYGYQNYLSSEDGYLPEAPPMPPYYETMAQVYDQGDDVDDDGGYYHTRQEVLEPLHHHHHHEQPVHYEHHQEEIIEPIHHHHHHQRPLVEEHYVVPHHHHHHEELLPHHHHHHHHGHHGDVGGYEEGYDKGEGAEHSAEDHSEHGEKGEKGYKGYHDFDKGEKEHQEKDFKEGECFFCMNVFTNY